MRLCMFRKLWYMAIKKYPFVWGIINQKLHPFSKPFSPELPYMYIINSMFCLYVFELFYLLCSLKLFSSGLGNVPTHSITIQRSIDNPESATITCIIVIQHLTLFSINMERMALNKSRFRTLLWYVLFLV